MPVRDRKIWIKRHNYEQSKKTGNADDDTDVDKINKYAEMEQNKFR